MDCANTSWHSKFSLELHIAFGLRPPPLPPNPQVTVLFCKECGRYLQPPKHWVKADPESKELLTFCIKRIKGLAKVKLVDAGFLWTEPHSKRLKVKLAVQAEVLNGAILQQVGGGGTWGGGGGSRVPLDGCGFLVPCCHPLFGERASGCCPAGAASSCF